MFTMLTVDQYAELITKKTALQPDVGIILGSGLGGLADLVEEPVFIDYASLPQFPVSTAPGHLGRFVIGKLCGKPVICMQGRLHYYEGHPMANIALPVRLMRRLGVKTLLVTNACGGVNYDFEVGDIMVIDDHINLLGTNPLIGPNADEFGPRFPDMSYAYDPQLRAVADQAGQQLSLPLRHGVYLAYSGPSYETPAEIRAFRILGADAVGMSTVPETIVANHCGMRVLGLSLVTNMAAGMGDKRLDGEHVIAIANQRAKVLEALVSQIVKLLPKG